MCIWNLLWVCKCDYWKILLQTRFCKAILPPYYAKQICKYASPTQMNFLQTRFSIPKALLQCAICNHDYAKKIFETRFWNTIILRNINMNSTPKMLNKNSFPKRDFKMWLFLILVFDSDVIIDENITDIPPGSKTKKEHWQSFSIIARKKRRNIVTNLIDRNKEDQNEFFPLGSNTNAEPPSRNKRNNEHNRLPLESNKKILTETDEMQTEFDRSEGDEL